MLPILARQVHLDFHTSEHIPDVGARFSKQQWQEALKLGRVNWINIFAKCHHGWSYYPTQVGAMHPTLKFDLLGAQIEACHEIGVRAPIYYTVGWSVHDAETHPEWCVRRADGGIASTNWDDDAKPDDRKPNFSWQFMCPSGGYLDLMLRQTEEICQHYPTDGLWYDITGGPPCYCENCRRGMADGWLRRGRFRSRLPVWRDQVAALHGRVQEDPLPLPSRRQRSTSTVRRSSIPTRVAATSRRGCSTTTRSKSSKTCPPPGAVMTSCRCAPSSSITQANP